ncbi:hypothetical protein Poly51_01670 [Rubripirellula tenax]|uniref:Competence protein A n=1 Tax=Rubripirellula tenax TaxID=2528015 RepID=A0A5C6FJJ3_9BACT|nr:hypothetical protein [Rubripirellula tenax]TWU59894.1 hypothetical protein Poly51_01670 [Rubripirellula tenax]
MRPLSSLTSLVSKWGQSSPRLHRRLRYVGIDIGIDRVTVAMLGWIQHDPKQEGTIGWISRTQFIVPVDPSAQPKSDWIDRVVETLTSELPRCLDGHRVIATLSLPSTWVHYQTVAANELATTKRQSDEMFRSSIFKSDSHVTHWPVVQGNDSRLVAATGAAAAARVAKAVADVGYEIGTILPAGAAMMHASSLTSMTPSSVILLDPIGGLIALSSATLPEPPTCGLCRTLPTCTTGKASPQFVDELEPWLGEVAAEYEATCRFATRNGAKLSATSPILIGGRLAHIDGVAATLATLTNRPVAPWRYAGRFRPSDATVVNRNHDATDALAISLAYCSIGLAGSRRSQLR